MKFGIKNFTILVLLLFLVVAGLSGCRCVPTATEIGSRLEKMIPEEQGEKEKKGEEQTEKEKVSCLTTEEFLKILPDKWPEPWQEYKRGCESGEDKDGCCETISFAVIQGNFEKSIEVWISDCGSPAEAIDYSDFLVNLHGKEYFEKTTYRGNPAYKAKEGDTITNVAAKRFVITLLSGGSRNCSNEELDSILGLLKVW